MQYLKRDYKKASFILLFLSCLSFYSSLSSALLPSDYCGDTLLSFQYRTYQTDHFWNKNGKKLSAYNNFKEKSIGVFLEFSITNRDALCFEGWYDRIDESVNGRTFGFEDSELSWRHLLWCDQSRLFTCQLLAIIPSGPRKTNLRYGRLGGEINFLYSNQFTAGRYYGYYDIQLGYRVYQGFPSDQIRNIVNIGFCPANWLLLNAESKLEYGLFNGKKDRYRNTILFNSNYRLLNAKLEAIIFIHRYVSLTLSYYRHIWGENVGLGGGFLAGTIINF